MQRGGCGSHVMVAHKNPSFTHFWTVQYNTALAGPVCKTLTNKGKYWCVSKVNVGDTGNVNTAGHRGVAPDRPSFDVALRYRT